MLFYAIEQHRHVLGCENFHSVLVYTSPALCSFLCIAIDPFSVIFLFVTVYFCAPSLRIELSGAIVVYVNGDPFFTISAKPSTSNIYIHSPKRLELFLVGLSVYLTIILSLSQHKVALLPALGKLDSVSRSMYHSSRMLDCREARDCMLPCTMLVLLLHRRSPNPLFFVPFCLV